MGALAARTVAGLAPVTTLTIADLDRAAGARLAAQCEADKPGVVRSQAIDVLDRQALEALLSPADVVLNTVGPFFRFGVPVLEAAIAAGTPYFDICDDPEPTLAMLALDTQAKAAGIPAVVGLGASPGLTNLLAVKAFGALDEVDELLTGWNLDGAVGADAEAEAALAPDGRPAAALVHWMEQCSGDVLIWEDSRQQKTRPLEAEPVTFPGIGKRTLWTVGHPEAVTLPLRFPALHRSVNVMVLSRSTALALRDLRNRIDGGRMSADEAAAQIGKDLAHPSWIGQLAETLLRPFDGPAFPSLFALAKGRLDGRDRVAAAHLSATLPHGMAGITGIPLALGVGLLAEGHITGTGVMAPEAAFEPDRLIEALGPYWQDAEGAPVRLSLD